jgi:hypothetical protein
LATARLGHTSTLLASGKVLVTGGQNAGILATSELYDPLTNTWSAAANLLTVHATHTATLLPSGKVLVAGGQDSLGFLATAELYDPPTNTWTAAGNLVSAHASHTATLLPSGKVLVTGGANGFVSASTELYDPGTDQWSLGGNLFFARFQHTATLLPSGEVVVVGGQNSVGGFSSSAERDNDTGAIDAWAPVVTAPDTLPPSASFAVAGTGFRGISSASSGSTTDSPTDYPIVILQAVEGSRQWTLPSSSFSATSATVTEPGAPAGIYLLVVITNGIPAGRIVTISFCAGVTCTAVDQCHSAGTCNPATGVCSNPSKANGTSCNDGNACTQTDT